MSAKIKKIFHPSLIILKIQNLRANSVDLVEVAHNSVDLVEVAHNSVDLVEVAHYELAQ